MCLKLHAALLPNQVEMRGQGNARDLMFRCIHVCRGSNGKASWPNPPASCKSGYTSCVIHVQSLLVRLLLWCLAGVFAGVFVLALDETVCDCLGFRSCLTSEAGLADAISSGVCRCPLLDFQSSYLAFFLLSLHIKEK
jgi:hypothetical protein